MSEIEQELIRKILVDLFLASPRKKSQIANQDAVDKTREKKPTEGDSQQAHKEKALEQI